MAKTQHQKAILNYLSDGQKTKAQIVNRFKSWYYSNSNKHIGDVLSRMVNAKMITRIKKGVYSLPEPLKDSETTFKGQPSLF